MVRGKISSPSGRRQSARSSSVDLQRAYPQWVSLRDRLGFDGDTKDASLAIFLIDYWLEGQASVEQLAQECQRIAGGKMSGDEEEGEDGQAHTRAETVQLRPEVHLETRGSPDPSVHLLNTGPPAANRGEAANPPSPTTTRLRASPSGESTLSLSRASLNTTLCPESVKEGNIKCGKTNEKSKTRTPDGSDSELAGKSATPGPDRKFGCRFCEKRFSFPSHLERHEPTHQPRSEWPLQCHVCDRRFIEKIRLRAHMRTAHKAAEVNEDGASESPKPGDVTKVTRDREDEEGVAKVTRESEDEEGGASEGRGRYRCGECGRRFRCQAHHQRHAWTHRPREQWPHACDGCDRRFVEADKCAAHQRACRRSAQCGRERAPRTPAEHRCGECGKQFRQSVHLRYHEWLHRDRAEWPHRCRVCARTFIAAHAHRKHEAMHAKTGSTGQRDTCGVCGKTFATPGGLVAHARRHSGRMDHQCEVCGKRYGWASHLRRHLAIHSDIKRHKCAQCPRSFNTPGQLRAHAATHTGVMPFPCPFCEDGFTRRVSLTAHLQVHADRLPHHCATCRKGFLQEEDLRDHEAVHDARLRCAVCHKDFRQRSQLLAHAWKHRPQEEWPYACEVCGKHFIRKEAHAMHTRRRHSQNRFRCRHCGAGFSRQAALSDHLQGHAGATGHVCAQCGRGFARAHLLARHVTVHSGERPLACTLCNKVYRWPANLHRHMKREHGQQAAQN